MERSNDFIKICGSVFFRAFLTYKAYHAISPDNPDHGMIVNCKSCKGTGSVEWQCPRCNGTGKGLIFKCGNCSGSGREMTVCLGCSGSGKKKIMTK